MYLWQEKNYFQLDGLTALVRRRLGPIEHRIVVALITQDVHGRDIVDQMI